MRAGKLDNRIEVYDRILVDDGYGGDDVYYNSIGRIWSKVTIKDGDEAFENEKVTAVRGYLFECRANTFIDWGTDKVIKYTDRQGKEHIVFIRGFADRKQQYNRIFIKGIQGNPSDFPLTLSTKVFAQDGSPAYAQDGSPLFSQEG